jgi:hypothetical protein
MKNRYRQYQKLLRILRNECPLAYPVEVRRVALKDLCGVCFRDGRKFLIKINRNMGQNMAIETLIHEWAHGLAWNHLHDRMDEKEMDRRCHDAEWGVAYSKVYRIYEEHFLEAFHCCEDSSKAA